MDLGHCLKNIRRDHGYSLRYVAKKSGYSPGYIADIESGRRLPKTFVLDCILGALSAREKRQEVFSFYIDAVRILCWQ
ncbi:helix-turn-helix transcriptional regulator [Oligoflexus sp.]|uniref:helix-turn-helix domain-containing protein n=1 Tax=Oligoflexus sp. TaxID=1971216 RepID=UPI002D79913D|nr:helix-turn-helix transcriptional regulator [Oligoflexus sp.]